MMRLVYYIVSCIFLAMLVEACVEPYDLPGVKSELGYLVIDGFVDTGNGSARVELTRSYPLKSNVAAPEFYSEIKIETDQGTVYTLTSEGNGVYSFFGKDLSTTNQCRLVVRTAYGEEYQSSFVEVTRTPEIDSLTWQISEKGLEIYVNTHDTENNTRYYRWEYEEAYEYRSAFNSQFVFDKAIPGVVDRTEAQNIYRCWSKVSSTSVNVATSVQLADDIISSHLLTLIPTNSIKHKERYSILARQFAITEEAFKYWQSLKKSTESIGTLFDPQPINLTGNVFNVNNRNEIVLGYFSAGTVTEKRIFVDGSDLPRWNRTTGYESCTPQYVYTVLLEDLYANPDLYPYLLSTVYEMGAFIGYQTTSITSCVDCRFNGGVNVKPVFWLEEN